MVRADTVGRLRESGYQPRSVKQELRDNLIARLRSGAPLFPGIVGYEESVIPQIENAVLSGQDVVFLGERGQAKTRMARLLVGLLDEAVPALAGCEINDEPLAPICQACRARIAEQGDDARHRVGPPRPPLRRETGDAGHHHRGSHRRGRPHQGRGRALSGRRAHHPLRAAAPHQSRHLRDQRAARPGRAHPGGPAQHHGRARRADPRLQGATAARPLRRGERQPRGLHQPRADHHAAQGPVRLADPHALPAPARARDRHHGGGAHALRHRRARDPEPRLHEAGHRGADPPGAPIVGHQPALRRLRACVHLQLREPALDARSSGPSAWASGRPRRG